jgi:hypothetical protein
VNEFCGKEEADGESREPLTKEVRTDRDLAFRAYAGGADAGLLRLLEARIVEAEEKTSRPGPISSFGKPRRASR